MAHRPSAAEDDFTCSPDIQYEIVRHKARGHIADIFEAKELGTGKVLAIKLFPQPKNRTQHMSVKTAVRHEVRMLELVQGGVSITMTRMRARSHFLLLRAFEALTCFECEPG